MKKFITLTKTNNDDHVVIFVNIDEIEYIRNVVNNGPDTKACVKVGGTYLWVTQTPQEILRALDTSFDLVAHLTRQRAFSEVTFGPGRRTAGVCDHIRKELAEIEADPTDIMEWVDVVILAFDGAWRAGWAPEEIVKAIEAKQARNEARKWPDWRTANPDKAIEHDRTAEAP